MQDRLFTDQEVTEACGLHVDNLRKLITWKAVIPAQKGGGRGKIRLWTLSHVRRISITASIHNAGYSLRLAHTITFCLPLENLLFVYDPEHLKRAGANRRGYFDPNKPKVEADDLDIFVKIANGRYVFQWLRAPRYFGEINEDRTEFISLWPAREKLKEVEIDPQFRKRRGKTTISKMYARRGEVRRTADLINPNSLAYRHDPDLDSKQAERAYQNPITEQSINVTLALRIACRMVLDLPVEYP